MKQAAPPAGQPATPPKPAAPKKNPLLKLIEPWPTAEKLKERRLEAEADPLFASTEPLAITLVGDFKKINKDRDPNSKQPFPGTLRIGETSIPMTLNARGHLRRMARTCDYVPLRVAFAKKDVKGTLFERQDALKLVVQCAGGGEFEQFMLREHLAYRIFNVITSRSFRTRLARVTYVDAVTGKAMGTRAGMFLEDEAGVARRMEGRIVEMPRLRFEDLDTDTLMPMMIFEYMIGNTDYSIYALHNVRIVQRPDKSLHPIPYDLDVTGLVNPPYGIPARGVDAEVGHGSHVSRPMPPRERGRPLRGQLRGQERDRQGAAGQHSRSRPHHATRRCGRTSTASIRRSRTRRMCADCS